MVNSVQISNYLNNQETNAVNPFLDNLTGVTGSTALIWVVKLDKKNQRYLQLRDRATNECFIELAPKELNNLSHDDLIKMIISGERPCESGTIDP